MYVRVTRRQYNMQSYVDGVEDSVPELVGGEWVKGWLKSADWFNNLVAEDGQPPELHEKLSGGVIKVTRYNPEGVKHVTLFTPTRLR